MVKYPNSFKENIKTFHSDPTGLVEYLAWHGCDSANKTTKNKEP